MLIKISLNSLKRGSGLLWHRQLPAEPVGLLHCDCWVTPHPTQVYTQVFMQVYKQVLTDMHFLGWLLSLNTCCIISTEADFQCFFPFFLPLSFALSKFSFFLLFLIPHWSGPL